MLVLGKFLRWIVIKFTIAALVVALGLAAGGLWLFLKDNVDFDQRRQDLMRTISGERAKTQSALDDVHRRLDRFSAEISTERERARQADKVIAQLKGLESKWDRLIGNPEQQQANAAQLDRMMALRATGTARVQSLQQEFTRTTWERDGLELALGKLDARLKTAEEDSSRVLHYLGRAWNYPLGCTLLRPPVTAWVFICLGLYLLGPTAGKFALCHVRRFWKGAWRSVMKIFGHSR